MTKTQIQLQPAFILQQRQYRETSVILELLTRDHGLIAVLAKGVRKSKSKTAALLRPFQGILISCSGTGSLMLLTQVELAGQFITLQGIAVYCGFYLNELVLRFLLKFDPYPEVYSDYADAITALQSINFTSNVKQTPVLVAENQNLEQLLRCFELKLMQNIGYGLETTLESDTGQAVRSGAKYHYHPGHGVVLDAQGSISGDTLLAIARYDLTDPRILAEAKQLMRKVIDFHLQGKALKSRLALTQIYQQL